jgi:hypothetical protein
MCWAQVAVAAVTGIVGAKSQSSKVKRESESERKANQLTIERNRERAVTEQENYAKQALVDAQQQELESALSIGQIELDIAAERVRAQGEMNDRLREYLRTQSSNRAAISASGLYSNVSYEKAIAPENRKTAKRDQARTLAAFEIAKGRGEYEITVNKLRSGRMWDNYAETLNETGKNIAKINSGALADQITNRKNAKEAVQYGTKSAWIGAGLEFAGTAVSLSASKAKLA